MAVRPWPRASTSVQNGDKLHPMRKLADQPFAEALLVLNQIVQLA